MYMISKGSLKPAQKNFNHLKNEWEIFLEATSTVDLCPDPTLLSLVTLENYEVKGWESWWRLSFNFFLPMLLN